MKISSSAQISFKGYDAAPIKNIYMLGYCDRAQKNILESLQKIGKKEGFNVALEKDEQLFTCLDDEKIDDNIQYKWSQDNKTFVNSQGDTFLLTPINQRKTRYDNHLGDILGLKTKESKTLFAGGNIYLGEKTNGESYILVGQDVIDDTAIYEHFKDYDFCTGCFNEVSRFKHQKNEMNDSYKQWPTKKEFEERKEEYVERAKNNISEDFGVKKENIFVVPQQVFHIDMFLRPIGYPYILVNSEEICREMVKDNLGFEDNESQMKWNTERYYDILSRDNKGVTTKDVVETLESYGFIPIEIGGTFGIDGMANFMNAIVNKHDDGTITYITNSSKCELEDYRLLEEKFDEQLKEKVPNLKKTHFIYGGRAGSINLLMENLLEMSGGLHCLTCEEPNFEIWG